jgi:glycosyltransferase involved in cell wall biosynthesis
MQSRPDIVQPSASVPIPASGSRTPVRKVALLTASRDRPYALGLAAALISEGVAFDFIGGDAVDGPELHGNPLVNFLNLRDQRDDAGLMRKMTRVLTYYFALIKYAVTTRSKIFHILWNNKFEFFDRTVLMLFYKALGKKIVFTVHNVNIRKRDGHDSWLNRLTLKIQYRLTDYIFVHTEKMKAELLSEFGGGAGEISVIPFGINSTVPNTSLTKTEARRRLGLNEGDKALLFFGNIASYKGLEYLIAAFSDLLRTDSSYRLIIAGKIKGPDHYWDQIQQAMNHTGARERIVERIEHIPDEETELYFKAADVLVLPYTHVFQSGVLFLGYNFGLPVIAADVGSLKEEIVEGKSGYIFNPRDSSDLAKKIQGYFASGLYRDLDLNRQAIQDFANERYSWSKVAVITTNIYSKLLNETVSVPREIGTVPNRVR